MNKKSSQLYLLPLLLFFVMALVWEMWVGPIVGLRTYQGFLPHAWKGNWLFSMTVFIYCATAFCLSVFLAFIIEEKRENRPPSSNKAQEDSIIFLENPPTKNSPANRQADAEAPHSEKSDPFSCTKHVTLQSLIDSISDALLVIDTAYHVRLLNKAARDLYLNDSHPQDKLLCHKLSHNEDQPCTGPEHECPLKRVMETGMSYTVLHHHFNKDGDLIPFEVQASPIFDDTGTIIGIVELARDATGRLAREQKQREADARLLYLQRQQSIATLAGGLAHEFNNITTSILGNAELLSVRLDETDANRRQTDAIIHGSELLAHLTNQLLAFAKGGKYQNQTINFNEKIHDCLHLINYEKFSETEVELDLAEGLWKIQGDPAQISQLIMNIIMNGFEALEKTIGKLLIHTSNENRSDKWQCRTKNIHPPGDYILFRVTNTGTTISDELMDKIFDPFFSTKFTGRGMGLAAAKGIAQSHHGCISVKSGADKTTFDILLPRTISETELVKKDKPSANPLHDRKVLVVDDEPQVISIIKSFLELQGGNVLVAEKGREALEIIERHRDDIDLVILDIQLPDMTGDMVYNRLKKIKPSLNTLISSGYEEHIALKNIMLHPQDKFIKKPFRGVDLMLKIKEVLYQE